MAVDFRFRREAMKQLPKDRGVYVLADLDGVPVYVGKSTDGIQSRVRRHLTSARSDIIANRQIDVWEIAQVWAYPVEDKAAINVLESVLYHHFNPKSPLMNGTVPALLPPAAVPEPSVKVHVMSEKEITERKALDQRLSRQASHYAQMVGHFLSVKQSKQVARAMAAHFDRLAKYHKTMLKLDAEEDDGED